MTFSLRKCQEQFSNIPLAGFVDVENDGKLSLVRNLFGFSFRPAGVALSMRTQFERYTKPRAAIKIVLPNRQLYDNAQLAFIFGCVETARKIWDPHGIGIILEPWKWFYPPQSPEWWSAPTTTLESEGPHGPYQILQGFAHLPKNSVQIVVVKSTPDTWAGYTVGEYEFACSRCPDDGQCGVVISLNPANLNASGRALAHELGHYFGLAHGWNNTTSLMNPNTQGTLISAEEQATAISFCNLVAPNTAWAK